MSENIPNLPKGAVPPKSEESAKVQPKKETVRINLPPKPSAAPTIKLPSLPPGGPPASAGAPAPKIGAAPGAAAPRVAAGPAPAAAPGQQQRAAQKPAPAAHVGAPALSPIDNGLAIAGAVVSLLVLGSVIYLVTMIH